MYDGIGMYVSSVDSSSRGGSRMRVLSGVASSGLVPAPSELRDSDIAAGPGCQFAHVQPAHILNNELDHPAFGINDYDR